MNPNVTAAPAVIRIIHAAWSGYVRLAGDGTASMVVRPEQGRWRRHADGLVEISWHGGAPEVFRVLRGELVLATLPDPASLPLPPHSCPAADLMAQELIRVPAADA